jgi:signal peptidase I
MVEPRIFPRGMPWNEDNYGPLIVPKKGYTIPLTLNNVEQWEITIDREYGKKVVEVKNGMVTIEGKPVTSYTFKKDYYFMMGDNRDDSLDSRFWGFVARDMVVGEAFITLFSWDRNIPFSDLFKLIGSIRLDRVLKLLH